MKRERTREMREGIPDAVESMRKRVETFCLHLLPILRKVTRISHLSSCRNTYNGNSRQRHFLVAIAVRVR